MAKAKQIIKRRKSVQNTMKITRTMEMISTANFKKAGNRTAAFRPYAESIRRLTARLSHCAGDFEHPLLSTDQPEDAPTALLVITANRGLCGSYNSGVFERVNSYIEKSDPENLRVYVSGKKGISFFRKKKITPANTWTEIDFIPKWDEIEAMADDFAGMFQSGEIGGLTVIYQAFLSNANQKPELLDLLPMTASEEEGEERPAEDYIFMPGPEGILEEILPMSFKVNLFKCFLDAGTSEQIYRMRAMKGATSAAEKMIKHLTQQYNRARQTQITMELLDIIGGTRQ